MLGKVNLYIFRGVTQDSKLYRIHQNEFEIRVPFVLK
jgi:hypothetical protein